MTEEIKKYWEVQPPFKAKKGSKLWTLEWSNSILKHRHKVVPYLKSFMDVNSYKGKNVLEIGYGSGSDMISYAKAGARVIGIDITEKSREITEKRLVAHKLANRVYPFIYFGKSILVADSSEDLVYSCGVLHHTPFMDDLLSESYRVLHPGGKLKLMLYHRNSLLYYYSILYAHRNQIAAAKWESREALLSKHSEFRTGCPYTRVFSKADIEDRLLRLGFREVDLRAAYLVYDTSDDRKLDGYRKFDLSPCGVFDIDNFFYQYNKDISNKIHRDQMAWKYGWHLLVEAIK